MRSLRDLTQHLTTRADDSHAASVFQPPEVKEGISADHTGHVENALETGKCLKGSSNTGGAWLSSARVVRCWVKSRNERNPYSMLPADNAGDSWKTAGVNSEEGGDDVKSSCPLCPGLQTRYNGRYKGLQTREGERIP